MQVFVDISGIGTVTACVNGQSTLGDLRSALLKASPQACVLRHSSYFSFRGKPLQDASTIASQGISNQSTLRLTIRVLGGGGDGGATGAESRDCYLNMYATKKPDKVDPNEARIAKWTRCALSAETLKPPCVIDLLGNLYNKEALVSALLTKNMPPELKHIKGLRDMIPIYLTSVPGVDAHDDTSDSKFQCPISGQEFNGKYKFYVLRGCGHVLSSKALKEVQTSSCLVCFTPYAENDKVVVNGTEEEVLDLKRRMEEEATKKKEKKTKNGSKESLGVGSKGAAISNEHIGTINGGNEVLEEGYAVGETNGSKRKLSKEKHQAVPDNSRDPKLLQPSKKFRAVDKLPPGATKEVYASIFCSSNRNKVKETFMCRALPLGRN